MNAIVAFCIRKPLKSSFARSTVRCEFENASLLQSKRVRITHYDTLERTLWKPTFTTAV
jgi:hypothetical protein